MHPILERLMMSRKSTKPNALAAEAAGIGQELDALDASLPALADAAERGDENAAAAYEAAYQKAEALRVKKGRKELAAAHRRDASERAERERQAREAEAIKQRGLKKAEQFFATDLPELARALAPVIKQYDLALKIQAEVRAALPIRHPVSVGLLLTPAELHTAPRAAPHDSRSARVRDDKHWRLSADVHGLRSCRRNAGRGLRGRRPRRGGAQKRSPSGSRCHALNWPRPRVRFWGHSRRTAGQAPIS